MNKSNEKNDENGTEVFTCNICDSEFMTMQYLQYHTVSHDMAKDNSGPIPTLEIKLPADTLVTGQYIAGFKIEKDIKNIDTPDGHSVIHIKSHAGSVLELDNPNDIDFTFVFVTIDGGKEIRLARAKYDAGESCIRINNNWVVWERFIENKTKGAVTPKQRTEQFDFLKIALNEKHFEALRSNSSTANLVTIRFKGGPPFNIGFNRNGISFVSYGE